MFMLPSHQLSFFRRFVGLLPWTGNRFIARAAPPLLRFTVTSEKYERFKLLVVPLGWVMARSKAPAYTGHYQNEKRQACVQGHPSE
jgi:hypothetical protein